MIKKVVLLNDTSYENHHGCNIVISNIEKNLIKRDIEILYKNPIGVDWEKNKEFLNFLKISDAVIINAEGTIHDNSEYALSLLKIVEYTNKACFIINMTYQNNDEEFAQLVSKFKKVFVRESYSYTELKKHNIDSTIVADMTFYKSNHKYLNKRNNTNIIVTDSHDIKKSEKLFIFSKEFKFDFIPLLSPQKKFHDFKAFTKKIKYYSFKLIKGLNLKYKYKRFSLIKDEDKFLNELFNCKLLISARFHAICLSLHYNTPFIALNSNTFKIEALLKDMGLNKERIVSIDDLNNNIFLMEKYKTLSSIEKKNVEDYIAEANIKIEKMFDEIKSYKTYEESIC